MPLKQDEVAPLSVHGSTQHLAVLAGTDKPGSIGEVLERLAAIRDHATDTSLLEDNDGIAAFTRLYHVITDNIDRMATAGQFADSRFLVRLDIEFAWRYLEAIKAYAADMGTAPRCWRILFDRRADPGIPAPNFAAAGVNAHINFDLAAALVTTWDIVGFDGDGPASPQHRDYGRINDVFEEQMDPLREDLGSLLSRGPDDAPWDRFANWATDIVIRFTRDLAWDEAMKVWSRGAGDDVKAASNAKLDWIAAMLGEQLLRAPFLPV